MTEPIDVEHVRPEGPPINPDVDDIVYRPEHFEELITRGIVPTQLSGHDPQTDNIFRVYRGYAATRAHAPLMHGGPGGFDGGSDLADRIRDLLSDLHHHRETAGIDWMWAVGSSVAHYEDEISGNGGKESQ